ncbi:general substrate transporter [Talaromyces proteolyticus]|uniref:General substrate transporter n=1 Tax=Talaromyces proteolyticus TaxID=1131652 RepID=A0AAD4PZT8_9EURO|nr:general substrate transporter [Talaromyces proteolyticus]KAH8696218.1 general substrate transporter [Talaromyces proteolyticus]
MAFQTIVYRSPLATYARSIRNAPRQVICNGNLVFTALILALSAVPLTWDQGSSSVISLLPGFQHHFGISSGTTPSDIKTFVSIVYIGYAIGAVLSFFINDRIGRLWSYRLYIFVWIVGQITAALAPSLTGLWASRIVSGMGLGSLSVIGPMTLVEIAPSETRGLLTSWFVVAMAISSFTAIFCVYGVYLHLPPSNLQFQIVWFAPAIFMFLCAISSFFICESPRWLLMVNRREEAVKALVRLRGLPIDHPRVLAELSEIETALEQTGTRSSNILVLLRAMFTVRSNLRRLQLSLISYAFAQLSGANSITSYFVPIMKLLGVGGGNVESMFLSGMYSFSKLWFLLFASFFLVDGLGRRRSLFLGITVQMLSHIYIAVFIKYVQQGPVSNRASQAAIAAVFIHAFGYAVGLFILPYVFGGELWPNRLRTLGGALGQTFHWLFIYAMSYSLPELLASTNNWGAFLFFAGFCFLALVYVFFMVPDTTGISVEQIDEIFNRSWFTAYKHTNRLGNVEGVEDIPNETSRIETRIADKE